MLVWNFSFLRQTWDYMNAVKKRRTRGEWYWQNDIESSSLGAGSLMNRKMIIRSIHTQLRTEWTKDDARRQTCLRWHRKRMRRQQLLVCCALGFITESWVFIHLRLINIRCARDRSAEFDCSSDRRRRDYDEHPISVELDCSIVHCLNQRRPFLFPK